MRLHNTPQYFKPKMTLIIFDMFCENDIVI